MRDWILTVVLAAPLTFLAVNAMGMEREIAPIGITFGMCVLISGALVRMTVDGLAKRRKDR